MKYLVFDAGGTFIKYGLMEEDGTICEKSEVPTPAGPGCTLEDFIGILENIYRKYEGQVKGIGISAPGVIDSAAGYCYSGGFITYICGQNPAKLLEERCHVPVTIENDGKCAALAECWKGSLKGVRNGAVLILGTGVGGGLVIDGKIYKGSRFSAGEYSYILTNGNRDKDELSYWGRANGAQALAELVEQETGISAKALDGYKIFGMVSRGDPGAWKALRIFSKRLAVQIYNLQALLDLERIAIGGGISRQPILLELIRESLKNIREENPLLKFSDFIPDPKVVTCTYYNDSNLIGALYHHLTLTSKGGK